VNNFALQPVNSGSKACIANYWIASSSLYVELVSCSDCVNILCATWFVPKMMAPHAVALASEQIVRLLEDDSLKDQALTNFKYVIQNCSSWRQ
jgi:hypothetical protein